MGILRCAGIGVLLSLLAAPAPAKVKIFPSKQDKITNYKTFQWDPIRIVTRTGFVDDDPTVSPMIRAAITRELTKRGYVEVKQGAEFRVLAAGLNERSSQLEGFLLSWGFDPFWGYGVSAASTLQRVNEEGVIIVTLLNTKTESNIWTGYSTQSFGRKGTLNKTIDKATTKLFKKLPARVK